ncbi:thiamine diphosphokinase [Cognatishimia sp. F0-27]|uniref:thiamine diphosphokinase n=1 Tax=Cognatishimia sp. F0-27 TaxID=2816855 RepID=UPI001D0BF8CD|nr:thiamine diphosphokinase [Cognatishimia sp. F0-27]MCC1493587.1 thiamine diphosphokinase [Cognatishimia sp. F0-27]
MNDRIVRKLSPILLVGGGDCRNCGLSEAMRTAQTVVAADGGAEAVLARGRIPDAVIGDMDSLSPQLAAQIPAERRHQIAEQDSTDFDKALRSIAAPMIRAFGFTGKRLDHQLAVLSVLARYPEQRVVLVGAEDVTILCPPRITVPLAPGTRVSLWPLAPVSGRSTGLRWPIDGIAMAPDGRVGTSNEALGPVTLDMAAPRMLLILPASCREALETAAQDAPQWPARAE